MVEPALNYVACPELTGGTHRMAYWQWGQAHHPHVVVCLHGLSRQGRDFDVLAQALCAHAASQGRALRIVCPDLAGRGQSDRLQDPQGYQVPVYVADMLALLAQLHQQAPLQTLDWVGTSLGGLVGMVLAGQPGLPLPVPLRKLVLNDVGPALPWNALQRIGQYLGKAGVFSSLEQAADAMWAASSTFGPHTREQWLALSKHMVKPAPNVAGQKAELLALHYDPAIAVPFCSATQEGTLQNETILWQLYDQIQAQTLLLRGAQSDLLQPQTALQMTQRGPRAQLVEFAGVGHAPTLVASDQVDSVAKFLLGEPLGTF